MELKNTKDLEKNKGYEPIGKGRDEYVCIHATGTGARAAGEAMLKQGLVLSMDQLSDFSWQIYLKNGNVKSNGCQSINLLVKRENLEEAMSALRSSCKEGLYAYALPVLATEIIHPHPLSMGEVLFGR